MESNTSLIIGLGNPGAQYRLTYHNAGSLALDYFIKKAAETMTLVREGRQQKFEFWEFGNGRDLIFVKPLIFMNESGETVRAAVKFFSPQEILIIHDDSDIELGKFKISFGRGAAGHHGAESVIKALKTKKFRRLRIGVRKREKAGETRKEAEKIVLKKINLNDKTILEKVFKESASKI